MAIGITRTGNVVAFTDEGRALFTYDLRDGSLSISAPGGLKIGRLSILSGPAAPEDGSAGTGAGIADAGSLYVRTDAADANVYLNRGTMAEPAWVALISV